MPHGRSEVDRFKLGQMHLQNNDDIKWEPIADDKYSINISDDETPGPSGPSSTTTPTNLFLRTMGRGSARNNASKTVVGQRRASARATSSGFLFQVSIYVLTHYLLFIYIALCFSPSL